MSKELDLRIDNPDKKGSVCILSKIISDENTFWQIFDWELGAALQKQRGPARLFVFVFIFATPAVKWTNVFLQERTKSFHTYTYIQIQRPHINTNAAPSHKMHKYSAIIVINQCIWELPPNKTWNTEKIQIQMQLSGKLAILEDILHLWYTNSNLILFTEVRGLPLFKPIMLNALKGTKHQTNRFELVFFIERSCFA